MLAPGTTIGEAAWDECESVIRRFEDAWQNRGRPDIGAFVSPDAPHTTKLLVELVHVDLEFRLRAGDGARIEDYLARYPQLAAGDLLDLLVAEFTLRNRHRPPAYPEEFWLRFPELMDDLRELLADDGSGFSSTRPAERSDAHPTGVPVIPGYEFHGELGRGGMGVVYKARDTLLNRTVAVKTFATVPRPEACARFAREAEAIAGLDHAHIVPVFTVGEWRASDTSPVVPYFAMKWYPGGSLDDAPSGPGTPPADHARTVEAIAFALHHAHQRGILHRDLKPSNILLDEHGQPHVADFGLAGRLDPGGSAATQTGVVIGTPAYMAPEQARRPKEVSTAADVYGLGAILYHQLTGRPPFAGDTPLATLQMVEHDPPVPPSAVNPDVPRDLDTICLKCLEKDPERRYASAKALGDDLRRWRDGVPITARPVSPWEHAWRRVRRHPLITALALTTFAALVGSIVVLGATNARILAKERETTEALVRECSMRDDLQKALAREQHAAYVERVSSAGRLYSMNQLPQAWALLDQCPEHLRGWEWRYLDSLRRAECVTLAGHSGWIVGLGYLADGRLVSGDTTGKLRVWTADGRLERTIPTGHSHLTSVSFHPKRNWAAVGATNTTDVWDLDTGAKIAEPGGAHLVAFSPDGTLAAVANDKFVRFHTLPGWEPAGELRGHDYRVSAIAFRPGGKMVVTASLDRTIRTWDVGTQQELRRRLALTPSPYLAFTSDGGLLVEGHDGTVLFMDPITGDIRDSFPPPTGLRPVIAAGPEPTTVAIAGLDNEVIVWDIVRRRAVRTFRGQVVRVGAIAFGPGGRVASGGGDKVVRVWDRTREQEVRTLGPTRRGVSGVSLSADGAQLAVGPRGLGNAPPQGTLVLDPVTGRELHKLPGGTDVAFHPSTSRLATGRVGGGLILWDTATGKEIWNRPAPPLKDRPASPSSDGRVAFSPDGSRLASWTVRSGVQLWNAADGADLGHIPFPAFVYGLAFSPDGTELVAAAQDAVTVWDVATRTPRPREAEMKGAYAIAFSPSGQWLATADRDRTVRLRDAATGEVVRTFVGNSMRVFAVGFSPDGTRLLTGGTDKTVRVWDVATGRELLSLPGVTEMVTGVAWDHTSDRIYAVDDAVRVWEP